MSDWRKADETPQAGRLVELQLRDGCGPYFLPGACVVLAEGGYRSVSDGYLVGAPVVAWRYLDVQK